ncbi:unnamed protein product [Caenorhabditis brenneri]
MDRFLTKDQGIDIWNWLFEKVKEIDQLRESDQMELLVELCESRPHLDLDLLLSRWHHLKGTVHHHSFGMEQLINTNGYFPSTHHGRRMHATGRKIPNTLVPQTSTVSNQMPAEVHGASKKIVSKEELRSILRFVVDQIKETGSYEELQMSSKELWKKYKSANGSFPDRPTPSLVNKWRYALLNGEFVITLPIEMDELMNMLQLIPIRITPQAKQESEHRFSIRIELKDQTLEN